MSDLLVYAVFGLSLVVAAMILFDRDIDWNRNKTRPVADPETASQEQRADKPDGASEASTSFDDPIWQRLDERLAERKVRFPYKG